MRHFAILAAALSIVTATRAPADAEDSTAFFESRIRPVLVERCYKCHSGLPNQPRADCVWTTARHCCGVASAGRRSCRAGPTTVCSSRQSATKVISPRCPRTRSCRIGSSPIFAGGSPRGTRPARPESPRGQSRSRQCRVWTRILGLPTAARSRGSRGAGPVLGQGCAGSVHPRQTRSEGTAAGRRRRSLHLAAARRAGPRRLAAVTRADPSRSSATCRQSAQERVVDRFLASPAFGERWARHWLDLTGYADQIGTANDIFAEHAWRYRDYVIAAFNADRPFDRFIHEQLAGDLLPYARPKSGPGT